MACVTRLSQNFLLLASDASPLRALENELGAHAPVGGTGIANEALEAEQFVRVGHG